MRKLVWDSSFRRAFKVRTRNDLALQARIFDTLDQLVAEPFHPMLKTHKAQRESGRNVGMLG